MKKLFGGIGLALLALVAVVVGRTLMVPTDSASGASAEVDQKFSAASIAEKLGEAIRFRTISWQDGVSPADIKASQDAFIAFRDWIEITYPAFSKTVKREIVGEYSLLFTWTGSDTTLKPVLLMAHMDVVPVVPGTETSWKHDPFSGTVADGFVYGRGTMDTKAGLIGQLEAAEKLISGGFQPKRTIMFSFGHDEEIGGRNGNARIAELLKSRNIKLEMVNDEGGAITTGVVPGVQGPVALIGVAEKGYVSLKLTARSAGGHSSLPPAVKDTAIGKLAHAIRKIEENPFESRIDGISREFIEQLMPAMSFAPKLAVANLWLFEPLVVRSMTGSPAAGASLHTTIAPTMIQGGVKENVLPPEATVTINFRIHPRDTIKGVEAHIRKVLDDETIDVVISNPGREPSAVSNVNGPQFALMKSVLQKVKPGVIVAPNLMVGGTDSRHFQDLTDSTFRFIPMMTTAEELKGFHGTDERISTESLPLIAAFYAELIERLDQPMAQADSN